MVVSSAATMPARAPASIAMLHTVMRPSIDSARIAAAGEFDRVAGAASGADLADDGQHDVFGRDSRAASCHRHAQACSSPSWRAGDCVAITCSTSRRADADARARRRRRACRYASRRTPRSCPAASRPLPDRSRGRCPGVVTEREVGLGAVFLDVCVERGRPAVREIGSAMPSCPIACGRRVVVGGGHDRTACAKLRVQRCASLRRPAGWSLHAPGDGRCRASAVPSSSERTTWLVPEFVVQVAREHLKRAAVAG